MALRLRDSEAFALGCELTPFVCEEHAGAETVEGEIEERKDRLG